MTWAESFYHVSVAAGAQQGLLTAAQAERAGAGPADLGRLADAGLIWEHDWSVYQLAVSPLSFQRASMRAAWLALRPGDFAWERPSAAHDDAVLSHHSAARFLGLGAMAGATLSFTAPGDADLETPRAVAVHRAALGPEDVVISDGIPVTAPHRTIVDLVRSRTAAEEVGRVVADAARRDLVDLGTLYADLAPDAALYDLPPDGPSFAEHLLGGLPASALPPRNRRGYASLRRPDRVEEVRRGLTRARNGAVEAVLVRDPGFARQVAAQIVGRAEADG
ncbi:hypothetical protein FZ103_17325 [Streptomonospora sp. PA3]|uniref:hypothetical protein n=1 Tax=Streptomonospora sp. PA3 TaxID=2607326 RepID=UPI0012DD5E01|nr:hypothetical protein [Streptomonospora sp. PA3]MUL42909.1 hypothetical protein [Streptomonospora sp. PA3]